MVVRTAAAARGSMHLRAATPAATVAAVPPSCWITRVVSRSDGARPAAARNSSTWLSSQPSPTTSVPATFGWRA